MADHLPPNYAQQVYARRQALGLAAFEAPAQTAALSLRFSNFWEVGGGLSFLSPSASQTDLPSHLNGFGRVGLYLPLDVNHRFAVPLRVEGGGGTEELYFIRFSFGLQIRVTDGLALGVSPLNPRRSVRRGARGEPYDRWSFPSGVEFSYSF